MMDDDLNTPLGQSLVGEPSRGKILRRMATLSCFWMLAYAAVVFLPQLARPPTAALVAAHVNPPPSAVPEQDASARGPEVSPFPPPERRLSGEEDELQKEASAKAPDRGG